MVSTTDARGVTMIRTLDAADRPLLVDYPGADLDTTYTYGTDPLLFEVGRLTGIERGGQTIAYAYDRFGRTIQDGELTYAYDENGNRTAVGYPGGVAASYTFDFADREATLTTTSPAGTTPVVTGSGYLPSGPLAALSLGNGATETRAFTTRYFPESIALDAARDRGYAYGTDAVGNVTAITETVECLADVVLENRTVTGSEAHQSCGEVLAGPAVTVADGASLTLQAATRVVLRDGFSVASGATFTAGTDPTLDGGTWTYGYQDVDYFLTSATGPWGDLAWTYDRIGSRLSETRAGWTDIYSYSPNGTAGNTPLLASIALAVGGTRTFTHGPAGHLTQVAASGNVVDLTYDAAGRLTLADRLGNTTDFTYDGRSYLAEAGDEAGPLGATRPTFSSEGFLHALTQRATGSDAGEAHHLFHFAGRPVAQLSIDGGGGETWRYLTTDHLGTPLVATDAAGVELWAGPFEPFGRDPWAGTTLAASAEDVFLRFPGQWDDEVWLEATRGAEGYYNVHRWYQPQTGRYTRPDPALRPLIGKLYLYAKSNPLFNYDPLGLHETSFPHGGPYHYMKPPESDFDCVTRIRDQVRREAGGRTRYQHCLANCYISKQCPGGGTVALMASLVKEAGDLGRCLIQRREGNCKSAFQPADFADNQLGRQCEPNIPCHDQCGVLRTEEEPSPGPFDIFSPGGDHSDGSSNSN